VKLQHFGGIHHFSSDIPQKEHDNQLGLSVALLQYLFLVGVSGAYQATM